VVEKTLDEATPPRADAQDILDVDRSGDCRALQMWLEQLATALRGSCSSRKADALAAIDLFDRDRR